MDNSSTVPASLDHLTTMPALLTQPASLQRDTAGDGIRPIHKWIFVLALLAFLTGLVVLR
jgi:hypothetical protein